MVGGLRRVVSGERSWERKGKMKGRRDGGWRRGGARVGVGKGGDGERK